MVAVSDIHFRRRPICCTVRPAMTSHTLDEDATHPALQPLREAGLSATIVAQVLAFYDEPHRVYHARAHVREMLDASVALKLPLSAAQGLAVLFHDAIYVPGAPRGANEALSAQLMQVYAHALPRALVEAARSIVLDTTDHIARTPGSGAVLDLDLLRLATPTEEFAQISQQVFAEVRPLFDTPDDAAAWAQFMQRRAAFFRALLEREFIYTLPDMHQRFEAVARGNLLAAISQSGMAQSGMG